jgi:tryptophan-rich sensory protein
LFPPGAWYGQLNKPSWTPPGWVFAPVWTILYLTMGLSLWLFWQTSRSRERGGALAVFFVQLALNAAWSWLFFGLHSPLLALFGISMLWGTLVATIIAFWRQHAAAGILLLPYLGWVSFASCLNLEIWQLNN